MGLVNLSQSEHIWAHVCNILLPWKSYSNAHVAQILSKTHPLFKFHDALLEKNVVSTKKKNKNMCERNCKKYKSGGKYRKKSSHEQLKCLL